MQLVQFQEVLRSAVRRHGLRQKLVCHLRIDQRADFFCRVGARCSSAVHHDARFAQHLTLGIRLQHRRARKTHRDRGYCEGYREREVDPNQEVH